MSILSAGFTQTFFDSAGGAANFSLRFAMSLGRTLLAPSVSVVPRSLSSPVSLSYKVFQMLGGLCRSLMSTRGIVAALSTHINPDLDAFDFFLRQSHSLLLHADIIQKDLSCGRLFH